MFFPPAFNLINQLCDQYVLVYLTPSLLYKVTTALNFILFWPILETSSVHNITFLQALLFTKVSPSIFCHKVCRSGGFAVLLLCVNWWLFLSVFFSYPLTVAFIYVWAERCVYCPLWAVKFTVLCEYKSAKLSLHFQSIATEIGIFCSNMLCCCCYNIAKNY